MKGSEKMKNERKYLLCRHCGNLVGVIQDSEAPIICCGEEMSRLVPNTVDAAQEKHIPVLEREGNLLTVQVGSTLHPMLPEHYIMWVAVAQKNRTQRVALSPDDKPVVSFVVEEEPVAVYAYCNLHGLWISQA